MAKPTPAITPTMRITTRAMRVERLSLRPGGGGFATPSVGNSSTDTGGAGMELSTHNTSGVPCARATEPPPDKPLDCSSPAANSSPTSAVPTTHTTSPNRLIRWDWTTSQGGGLNARSSPLHRDRPSHQSGNRLGDPHRPRISNWRAPIRAPSASACAPTWAATAIHPGVA